MAQHAGVTHLKSMSMFLKDHGLTALLLLFQAAGYSPLIELLNMRKVDCWPAPLSTTGLLMVMLDVSRYFPGGK